MKRFAIIAALGLAASVPAKADGLFLGANWAGQTSQAHAGPASRDPEVRAEDTDGSRAYKLSQFSVAVPFYGQPFQGRRVPDGICDAEQPKAWDNSGITAYKNSLPVTKLYTAGRGSCASVYYPGFTFFGGQPNMALAPHWGGNEPYDNRFLNWGG